MRYFRVVIVKVSPNTDPDVLLARLAALCQPLATLDPPEETISQQAFS